MTIIWGLLIILGVALIVWGAEAFAEHLGAAAVRLHVSSFALALLLAGAEPEELATAVAASLKEVPAIAFGDVVGANIAICLVALGVGAWIAPLPFSKRVMAYALVGVPIAVIATGFIWNGEISRLEGLFLIGLYVLYVAIIWRVERRPPALGETAELEEALEEFATEQANGMRQRVSQELCVVVAGVLAMVAGSILIVEAVRQISQIETTQIKLALSLVGFATAFELVILAWSTARRGVTEAAVAGVVGSFTYNVTMTLGVAAIARPLNIVDASLLHVPLIVMLGAFALVIALASCKGYLHRGASVVLLSAYPLVLMRLLAEN
ncbi:sodium:calcium antiporter [Parathermosynechococcus lividus]